MIPDRSLLFKPEMVRAILNTKPLGYPPAPIDPTKPFKAVTRRLVDVSDMPARGRALWDRASQKERLWYLNNDPETLLGLPVPFKVGQIIWVKETFYRGPGGYICYAATPRICKDSKGKTWTTDLSEEETLKVMKSNDGWKKMPSIFMSRRDSREDLVVVSVGAEPLKAITEQDAQWEGCLPYSQDSKGIPIPDLAGVGEYRASYRDLWNAINKDKAVSWEKNPLAWRVAFFRRAA